MTTPLPTSNVPNDCHADTLRLVAYWRNAGSGGALPGRQHIDPVDLKDLLGNIWIVDVERNPLRFRYRVVGSRIVNYLELEPTGKWLDEVIPHFDRTNTGRDLKIVAEGGVPRWRRGAPSIREDLQFKTLEQISLPLATDGKTTDMVLNLTLFLDEDGYAI